MDPRLWSFTQGIRLLIGILVLVVVSGFAVFGAWTALNILRFRRQQRQADEQFRAGRIDDEGNPLPPRAQGVCDRCGRVFNS
ncbi:MAG TPA: hypothetical protein VNT79_07245, partial [Phycisphaerae bacterium]|nr:hypothetical protein [Phycisphaerae bacterium]